MQASESELSSELPKVQQAPNPERRLLFNRMLQQCIKNYNNKNYNLNPMVQQVVHQLSVTTDQKAQQRQQLIQELTLITFSLVNLPDMYIQLLENETITSASPTINLNSEHKAIAQTFLSKAAETLQQKGVVEQYFSYENPEQRELFDQLIKIVNAEIAGIYDQCRMVVEEGVKALEKATEKSQIVNPYLLYKLLREVSEFCHQNIELKLEETLFVYGNGQSLKYFVDYVIQKFQTVRMVSVEPEEHHSEITGIEFLLSIEQKPMIHMTLRDAVDTNGQVAMFLKTYQQMKKEEIIKEDYLIKFSHENPNDLIVVSCKTLRKPWLVKRNTEVVCKNITKYLHQMLTNHQKQIEQLGKDFDVTLYDEYVSIDELTNTGGALGKSLANIKDYNNVTDFLTDISKRAIFATSFRTVMSRIPLLGYFFIAGALGYNFYSIMSNDLASGETKATELSGAAFRATSTIGSSIVGGVVGQALIPIPGLGAFVGAVIGGYLGDKGSGKLTAALEKEKFKSIMKYLLKAMHPEGFWLPTKELFEELGMKQKEFNKKVPVQMEKHVFLTVLLFILVCFHQAKKQAKFNNAQMQQQKKKKEVTVVITNNQKQQQNKKDLTVIHKNQEKKSSKFLVIGEQVQLQEQDLKEQLQTEKSNMMKKRHSLKRKSKAELSPQEQCELNILSMSESVHYQPEFKITTIILFLEKNGVFLTPMLKDIEEILLPFLVKMMK